MNEQAAADRAGMQAALDACRTGIEKGQSPFGAAIFREGRLIAATHNQVWATTDPTAHAEVTAIREACAALGTIDLSGAVIYSTTEPCPMCFAAIHWARIGRIVYGAAITDAQARGFNELAVSNATLKAAGGSPVELEPGLMRDEALELFDAWRKRGLCRPY